MEPHLISRTTVCRRRVAVALVMVALLYSGAPRVLAGTTCAVIAADSCGLADSQLVDLVELKLEQDPELVLLNRADIEKVLSEHALSLTMNGGSRQSRKNWGEVLRADLLVMMDARRVDDGRIIDVSVVETRYGLRLTREAFVWEEQTDTIAGWIARRVGQLGRKLDAGFDHVFAVLPFESDDLLYDFAHLKQSYARLVEAVLSRLPGVVVVEFEQAPEIARELAVSAGYPSVKRSLPLYIHGRYRNNGPAAERRIDLRLELRQGDETLGTTERTGLGPSAVEGRLRSDVLELTKKVLGPKAPAAVQESETVLEADLLEQRVEAFRLTGEWEEAAQLAEACLLLDPDRVRLHFRIFEASIRLMFDDGRRGERARTKPNRDERFSRHLSPRQRRQYALAGIEHFGHYVRHRGLPVAESYDMGRYWHGTGVGAYRWGRDPNNLRELQRAIGRAKLEVMLAILRGGRFGNEELGLQFLADYAPWTFMPGEGFDIGEYHNAMRRIVLGFDRYDRGLWVQVRLLQDILWLREAQAEKEFAGLLDRLEVESKGSASVAARVIRTFHQARQGGDGCAALDMIDSMMPNHMITPQKRGWLIAGFKGHLGLYDAERLAGGSRHEPLRVEDLLLTPILLKDHDGNAVTVKWRYPSRWYNCGGAGEILQGQGSPLLLMRERGIVEDCSAILGEGWGVPDGIAWDGRYLWLAGKGEDRQINVINPGTLETVAVFGRADGVLPTTDGCKLAALAPGRICAVGAFGRTWVGILTLGTGPNGQISKQVDVFHEARTVADSVSPPADHNFGPDYAFRPKELIPVPRADSPDPWILARRQIGLNNHYPGPLIIDPAARTVDVVPTRWSVHASAMVVGGRVLLAPTHFHFEQRRPGIGLYFTLAWADPPRFVRKEIKPVQLPNRSVGPAGSAVYHDGFVHWVSERWATIDVERKTVVRDIPLPRGLRYGRLVVSDSYGLVLYATNEQPFDGAWQVEFVDGEGRAETREFPQQPGKQSAPAESK